MARYCSKCGRKISYCTSCGASKDCSCSGVIGFHQCTTTFLVGVDRDRYCSKCGKSLPGPRYCGNCGARISRTHMCGGIDIEGFHTCLDF